MRTHIELVVKASDEADAETVTVLAPIASTEFVLYGDGSHWMIHPGMMKSLIVSPSWEELRKVLCDHHH